VSLALEIDVSFMLVEMKMPLMVHSAPCTSFHSFNTRFLLPF
jgi:hypothetical protein